MNKLKTTEHGGMPFNSDDIRFLDDSYRLALSDISACISGARENDAIIISGVRVTQRSGQIYDVSEGAVIYKGVVYHVYPHSINWDGSSALKLWFVQNYDPAGNKTFFLGNHVQTYERNYAVVAVAPPSDALIGVPYGIVLRTTDLVSQTHPLSLNVIATPAPNHLNEVVRNGNIAHMQLAVHTLVTPIPNAEFDLAQIHASAIPAAPLLVSAMVKRTGVNDFVYPNLLTITSSGLVRIRILADIGSSAEVHCTATYRVSI
jgi:hypothetical protein